jgi:phage/plasmid-like protein (TIGR03299 family)
MSHLIEQMAYVGAKPWHGLGAQLTNHQPIDIWAKEAGLDWEIFETPVRFTSNTQAALHSFSENKVLYRSDTNTALSVVGHRFKFVQPGEILEFYRDLTEVSGFELETAGVLRRAQDLGARQDWTIGEPERWRCDERLCTARHRLRRHIGDNRSVYVGAGRLQ